MLILKDNMSNKASIFIGIEKCLINVKMSKYSHTLSLSRSRFHPYHVVWVCMCARMSMCVRRETDIFPASVSNYSAYPVKKFA